MWKLIAELAIRLMNVFIKNKQDQQRIKEEIDKALRESDQRGDELGKLKTEYDRISKQDSLEKLP